MKNLADLMDEESAAFIARRIFNWENGTRKGRLNFMPGELSLLAKSYPLSIVVRFYNETRHEGSHVARALVELGKKLKEKELL